MKQAIIKLKPTDIVKASANVGVMEKTYYFEGLELTVSDGYHTFDELYDHRIILFIALCKIINEQDNTNMQLEQFKRGFAFDPKSWVRRVWRSKLHSDKSSYDGWFIMGIDKKPGELITYHLPMSVWDVTEWAETLDIAPEFDGHTPNDVLNRIKQI